MPTAKIREPLPIAAAKANWQNQQKTGEIDKIKALNSNFFQILCIKNPIKVQLQEEVIFLEDFYSFWNIFWRLAGFAYLPAAKVCQFADCRGKGNCQQNGMYSPYRHEFVCSLRISFEIWSLPTSFDQSEKYVFSILDNIHFSI